MKTKKSNTLSRRSSRKFEHEDEEVFLKKAYKEFDTAEDLFLEDVAEEIPIEKIITLPVPIIEKLEEKIIEEIVKPKKRGRKANKTNYYVDPERFKELIIAFYGDGKIGDELAMCIFNIANRIIYMPNFINYTYKEDMIGDAIIKCFQALKAKKYDPKLGNAFSYYSKICFHAFVNRIKRESKEHAMIQNYQTEIYDDLVNVGAIEASGSNQSQGIEESQDYAD